MSTRKRVTAKRPTARAAAAASTESVRYAVHYSAPVRCRDEVVRRLTPALAPQLPDLLSPDQLAELERGGLITRTE